MGYKLRPKDPAEEIRKVARQGIDKAIEALSAPSEERAEGVHQARKRFKELRALLRLVRKPLGGEFKAENQRLRDLGRALAESRDAAAMLESWDLLAKRFAEPFAEESFKLARRRLYDRARRGEADTSGLDQRIDAVKSELESFRERVENWKLTAKGFDLFGAGVKRTYADGCAELAKVRVDLSDEQLHEWRKRVKDHWYQTRLLTPGWPTLMQLRSDTLKQLADMLGDDHDLAMMRELMQQQPDLFGEPQQRERLEVMIAERRSELQSGALKLGGEIYLDAPDELVARWRRYWDGAQH
ncbi:CHAD domain-containing protein [Stutzerimonas zhaodongensis]|uniref:CHAD domain-containing protein n=1 Tax=Stutzerimonas zhaodongensis TaxID=1176257 RepID=UPI00210268E5|nr:CHAD domain-containing protein [Stutzerimonas zhaodongensis]MCQ2029404.1 CHAD domain-containing protein [Stutzerimonas zhaodongensis]